MIEVNGVQYRTLNDEIFVDGKKVIAAYCNKHLVYPERGNSNMIKVIGHVDAIIQHDHAGEDPSVGQYTYHGGGSYRAKGCFSLVIHNMVNPAFEQREVTIPEAIWPLNGSYSRQSSTGDIYGPGNAWVVFPYSGSSSPMIPNGDGIHPLLGSEAMQAHFVSKKYNYDYAIGELLLYIKVSPPPICSWTADSVTVNNRAYTDVIATPPQPYLDELPANVNGSYVLYKKSNPYGGELAWQISGALGKSFRADFSSKVIAVGDTYRFSYLKISTQRSPYAISYAARGKYNGSEREFEITYNQNFNILNIPITDCLYIGEESRAPEEHLHPRAQDIAEYIL